jgi:hypothetical protein
MAEIGATATRANAATTRPLSIFFMELLARK